MFNIKTKIATWAILGMFGASVASAAVPQSALVVGGIEYGASESYVRSVYGEPREIEQKNNPLYHGGQAVEFEYGNDFEILFIDGLARKVDVGSNNGVATAANIRVGSSVNDVLATYGQPDTVRGDEYIYYVEGDKTIGLVFEIEHGLVDGIDMGVIN